MANLKRTNPKKDNSENKSLKMIFLKKKTLRKKTNLRRENRTMTILESKNPKKRKLERASEMEK